MSKSNLRLQRKGILPPSALTLGDVQKFAFVRTMSDHGARCYVHENTRPVRGRTLYTAVVTDARNNARREHPDPLFALRAALYDYARKAQSFVWKISSVAFPNLHPPMLPLLHPGDHWRSEHLHGEWAFDLADQQVVEVMFHGMAGAGFHDSAGKIRISCRGMMALEHFNGAVNAVGLHHGSLVVRVRKVSNSVRE